MTLSHAWFCSRGTQDEWSVGYSWVCSVAREVHWRVDKQKALVWEGVWLKMTRNRTSIRGGIEAENYCKRGKNISY